jgi:hypothetical protein
MASKRTSRNEQPAVPSRGFDKELAVLESLAELLRETPTPIAAQVEQLRKSLGHRNNFIVSKAAKLVADCELFALLPDVLAAYDQFFIDAEKSDPQCWAKNALSKALVKLEHREKDAYLRGIKHHQFEPVWGGKSDTAGALRGTCTHALVNCPGISDAELLAALLDPLTDTDKTVRVEAARAIAQVGGVSAALLLRLRALLAKAEPEPEVLGACFSALLSLEGAAAIPVVAKALEDEDDIAAEAAFALADLRSPQALAVLLARHQEGADAWFAAVLLSAVALTRLPEALDFLIARIENNARDAEGSIEALGRISLSAEIRARVEQAVEQSDSSRLRQTLRKYLPAVQE